MYRKLSQGRWTIANLYKAITIRDKGMISEWMSLLKVKRIAVKNRFYCRSGTQRTIKCSSQIQSHVEPCINKCILAWNNTAQSSVNTMLCKMPCTYKSHTVKGTVLLYVNILNREHVRLFWLSINTLNIHPCCACYCLFWVCTISRSSNKLKNINK